MKLATKVTLALMAVFIASGILVVPLAYSFVSSSLQHSVKTSNEALSVGVLKDIDRILYERQQDVQSIAEDGFLVSLLSGDSKEVKDKEEVSRRFGKLTVFSGPWDKLSLVNADGEVVLSSSKNEVGKIFESSRPEAKAVSDALRGRIYHSDAVKLEESGLPTVIFSAPVRDISVAEEPVVGVVVGHFSWSIILEVLERLPGATYLYNEQGVLIGTNNPDDHKDLLIKNDYESESLREAQSSQELAKSKTLLGLNGELAVSTHAHQTGYLKYDGNHWVLVYEVPSGVAFAPAQRTSLTLTAALVVILTVSLAVILFLLRKVIVVPVRYLVDVVNVISSGKLDQKVEVNSKDEIGILGGAFNEMTQKLKLSYEGLEEKVEQRTMELKEERDRGRAIVESMAEGLFVVDKDYKVVAYNEMSKKILNISQAEDLSGKSLPQVFQVFRKGIELEEKERPVFLSLETGTSIIAGVEEDYSFKARQSDKKIPVSFAVSPLHGDGITGAVIVFKDVTNDKQSKEIVENEVKKRTLELNDEKIRLNASINSLTVGFIMTDTKGAVVIMNPMARKMFNLIDTPSSISVIKNPLGEGLDIVECINKCLESRQVVDLKEIEHENKFYHMVFAPIVSLDRNFALGTVILIDDITEEKILDRSKDEFFSIASHELRTPLTAILGNVDIMKDYYLKDSDDVETKEILLDIEKSSKRLIDIVNDFLNLSRLEIGTMKFNLVALSVEDLIRDTIQEFQVASSRKKLYLQFKQPETPLPLVYVDRDRAHQIFINLIGNGFKFTKEGGVEISAKLDGKGFVQINVEDTGMGIPKETQNLLFRKFQQAASSIYTRDVTKGTGLGLYISKLIVEGMGGKIWLEKSEVGKGSVFSFTLPIFKGKNSS